MRVRSFVTAGLVAAAVCVPGAATAVAAEAPAAVPQAEQAPPPADNPFDFLGVLIGDGSSSFADLLNIVAQLGGAR